MHGSSGKQNNRILFIDVVRAYAVFLALLAHALHNFGVPNLGDFVYNYPFFTSMATPLFIFMFGVMMDIVHRRKAQSHVENGWKLNITNRAFQCYLAYIITSISALLGSWISLDQFLKSLVFLESTRYGNILFIYTFSLLIMIPVISFGRNRGIVYLILIMFILLTLNQLIKNFPETESGYYSHLLQRITGYGPSIGGPSLMLGFCFIMLGNVVGFWIRTLSNSFDFYVRVFFIVLLFISIISVSLSVYSIERLKEVLTLYAYGSFRSSNDIYYFLFGSLFSIVSFCVIRFLVEKLTLIASVGKLFVPVGAASLLVFTAGNIYLNILGDLSSSFHPVLSLFFFYGCLFILALYHKYIPGYKIFTKITNLIKVVGGQLNDMGKSNASL